MEPYPLQSFVTKSVVKVSLFRISQYFIGLGCLFEFVFCLFISGGPVWMVFEGHLTVCLFDFSEAGRAAYAKACKAAPV